MLSFQIVLENYFCINIKMNVLHDITVTAYNIYLCKFQFGGEMENLLLQKILTIFPQDIFAWTVVFPSEKIGFQRRKEIVIFHN